MELSEHQKQYLRETQVDSGLLPDRDLPLHRAAYKGDNLQLSSLLVPGIDINTRSINDLTALQLAIRGDYAETVRIMLSAGADTALLDALGPYNDASFDAINGAALQNAQHALGALLMAYYPIQRGGRGGGRNQRWILGRFRIGLVSPNSGPSV